MNKTGKRNRSILWGWLCSYSVILLIPLVTVVSNYYANSNTIKNGLMDAQKLMANNVKDNIDSLLIDEQNLFSFIFTNDIFGRLRLYQDKDANFYYDVRCFEAQLESYCRGGSNIDCMIYFEEKDFIITKSAANNANTYYNTIKKEYSEMVDYLEWNNIISKQYFSEVFLGKYINYQTSEECLIYANTIPNSTRGRVNVFICIPISEIEKFTNSFPEDMFLLVTNQEDIVFALNNEGLMDVWLSSTKKQEKVECGEDLLYIQMKSNVNELIYKFILSANSLDKSLQETRNTFFLSLCVTILFGVTGVFIFIRYNYRPIRLMAEKMQADCQSGNEFQNMTNVYEKLQSENVFTKIIVHKQKEQLINTWLLSLMKGRSSVEEEDQNRFADELSINSNVAVIAFMLPNIDFKNLQFDELLFFIVNNIFCELMENEKFYHIEDGRYIFYIFEIEQRTNEEWHEYAMNKTQYICDLLYDKLDKSVIGVVSEIANDFIFLKFLYRKVMDVFEVQSLFGGMGVFDTSEVELLCSKEYVQEFIEDKLSGAIKTGNFDEALLITSELLELQSGSPFPVQQLYAFEICKIVLAYFDDYTQDPVQRAKGLKYVEKSMCAENYYDLKICMSNLLEYICMGIKEKWTLESKTIVDKIQECVEQYYQDANLSVGFIAEKLNRNAKYISRVFKEENGKGISNYISEIRIQKAREIMQMQKYTLEEVAEMVGYSNSRTFRRAFVKIVGELPSKFM